MLRHSIRRRRRGEKGAEMLQTTLTTVLAMAVQTGPARPPAPQATPEPLTFASDVRMIRLDVSVVDKNGRPVRGLGPRDFSIFENGKPVELQVFEAMEDGALATSTPTDEGGRLSLAVNADDPKHPSGQRIVIVADPSGLSPMQLARIRQGVSDFVTQRAQDGDIVRLINLSTREIVEGRIPADRMRLASAGRKISRRHGPQSPGSDGLVSDSIADQIDFAPDADLAESFSQSLRTERFLSQFARTGELLSLFDEIMIQLAAVPGRKSLIFISEGFPDVRTLDERLKRTAHLAREAQAAIHFVDVLGLDGLLPEKQGDKLQSVFEMAWARSGGSQELAEATGGFVSRFANVLTNAVSRAAEEARSYYIVGYAPVHRDDGRFRTVKVKVNRRGTTVRTKKGYIAGGSSLMLTGRFAH
jgi:VWFA-related protein